MAKGHFLYRLYDQVVGYHLAVPTPIIHPGETNLSAIPDVNIFIENRHQWASMHSFTSFQLDIHRIARSHEFDFFIPSSGHNQHPKLHHLACSVSCQSRKGQRSWVDKYIYMRKYMHRYMHACVYTYVYTCVHNVTLPKYLLEP